MILERQFNREDGTVVVLTIEGAYNVFTGKLDSSVFAKSRKPGEDDWNYHYPPRKGDSVMTEMSVADYLSKGWASVVKPSEVVKLTVDFIGLLNRPA